MQTNYDSPLVGWYFKSRMAKTVELAELGGGERVPDFGCEEQRLRQFLPSQCRYVGYDIDPAFSSVKDYTKLRGIDVVFCIHSLEHFDSTDGLAQALRNFKKMGARKVVVALPAENTFNHLFRFVFRWDAWVFFHHALPLQQVALELKREYGEPYKCERDYLLQYTAVYEVR